LTNADRYGILCELMRHGQRPDAGQKCLLSWSNYELSVNGQRGGFLVTQNVGAGVGLVRFVMAIPFGSQLGHALLAEFGLAVEGMKAR
jgi:hypothetical protein